MRTWKPDEIVLNSSIKRAIKLTGYTGRAIEECRLDLCDLILKAQCGYALGHTEEAFLKEFNLLKKNREPNKKGKAFLLIMMYASSNQKPVAFELMEKYRN
ncbi:hypothetical protein [Vibrio phage LP.1]|nr:hypothetical protein [Vibrio phage LP.1]